MPVNYQNGKIYTIRCYDDPGLLYVGSTAQPLYKRFSTHKTYSTYEHSKNRPLYKTVNEKYAGDWSQFYIELYEQHACNNREELNKREGEIIRELGSTLNKNIAGRTRREWGNDTEYWKNWRRKNPEYHKEWVVKNPDYYKNYRNKVKEKSGS